ncbi:thiol reductant ABC exporter subunit CydD [Streptomyces chumphonensis]|uniref:Thiol reductant ABC exporter subunit CydD n=1 Tax=Streptomyces chumphonensis TaxID=1214925 RepID=A0A927F1Y4_9ACTN|nr:thiol reductant ABC exporter subunit CydD [Streptomyces chumphonensis]MBD3933207.1 thiol reductant ABC exporter subunit CydD [Streptomyces chumphonensis]
MRPIDPRLIRHARATRLFLLAAVVLGLAGAGLVIGQAMLIAEIVVRAFQEGADVASLGRPLLLLVLVSLGRALVAWLTELSAHRSSAAVKSQLRMRLLVHASALGPAWLGGRRTGELTTLATRGVDALDDYFARYLPQLGLAAVVPAAVLARIVWSDWIAAATIAVTLPLIPVFMVLIGWATQAHMDRQWRLLARLSHHFLDLVDGLPTLRVFGRAKAQADNIRAITGDYRSATLRTLRIAFLSSFALELLATISVALVAVGIGMRLVHGEMDLYTGLVVLILAPEAYLPLRQVGAQYHAAAEGIAAADEAFAVLETPLPEGGDRTLGSLGPVRELRLDGVSVRHEGRTTVSLPVTDLTVRAGETVALVGPSGAGKSTLLSTVLGFTRPDTGRVRVDGVDLAELDLADWHRRIAWLPQHPYLFAGTVADNVRLARPQAGDDAVRAALRDAGAAELDASAELGEGGSGLSAGQRQRVALARAFLADRPVLLLDEPTAALDGATEGTVVDAIRRLAAGRTVLLVVHRPALLAVADRVVRIGGPPTAKRPSTRTVDGGPSGEEAPEPGAAAGRAREEVMFHVKPVHVKPGHATPPSAVTARPSPAVEAAPEAAPALGALRRVRSAGRRLRGRFALAATLGALALASAVGLMAVSGWLISRASEQPPVLYLLTAVTATRAFGIGRAVFRYAERLVSHDAVLRVLADLRVAVYARLERLAPAALHRSRRGDVLARLVGDVDALQDYFLRWLLPVVAAGVVSVGATGFTAWLLPEAGAALAVGLLLAGVGVPWLTSVVARRAGHRLAPARGTLSARTVELLTGVGELTVAGALPSRVAAARRADAELTGIAARGSAATALAGAATALVTGVTVCTAAAFGAAAVQTGRLEGVWLAVVVLTPLAAFEGVLGLPSAVQYRQRVRRSAERLYEVMDAPEPVREPRRPLPEPDSVFPLELRNVTVRHPGQQRPALAGIDLTLTPGRRVAVVGRSGSGKTTLAHTLLRFLEPESGTYVHGGADAASYDSDAVRRGVGLCAQDAHLFDSTLRENLRLARPGATDADLRRALARARLLDWVAALPQGLDTPVGEHGARLSGGQRQRLALARALLAGFPVLVLDEPAEHLDLETADALTADLLAATEGRTTLLITHRLAGLAAVDEVVVLEGGRCVQRGPYAQLSAVPGPLRELLAREAESDALRSTGGRDDAADTALRALLPQT